MVATDVQTQEKQEVEWFIMRVIPSCCFHGSAARELPDVLLEHSRQVDAGFGLTPQEQTFEYVPLF